MCNNKCSKKSLLALLTVGAATVGASLVALKYKEEIKEGTTKLSNNVKEKLPEVKEKVSELKEKAISESQKFRNKEEKTFKLEVQDVEQKEEEK